MTVEIFAWPDLYERMCRTLGSISVSLASQAASLPTMLPRPVECTYIYIVSVSIA